MDRIARALAMDPVALDGRNLLREGDTSEPRGSCLAGSVSAEEVLESRAGASCCIAQKRRFARRQEKSAKVSSDGKLRGTGVALFLHGSGFHGGGELRLASRAGLELTEQGVRLPGRSTEIGQGTRTMLSQIVADALAIPYEDVLSDDPTPRASRQRPDGGVAHLHGGGRILMNAARDLRALLGAYETRASSVAARGRCWPPRGA